MTDSNGQSAVAYPLSHTAMDTLTFCANYIIGVDEAVLATQQSNEMQEITLI
jgi:hypothetical protein